MTKHTPMARAVLVPLIIVLVCSVVTISFSQETGTTAEPPLLTFADLQKDDHKEGPFRIEGFVIQVYQCPPCPRGAMCKPCLGDHIVVTDHVNNDSPTLIDRRYRLRVFTDKPEQFEMKKKYSFTVRLRGQPSSRRAIDAVELIAFADESVKQSPDVLDAYRVCQAFEHLMGKNLDFAEAYEATFMVDKARRRAIAIADGEFGDLDFSKIDDDSLIKAYKLRMQIFFWTLPLTGPSNADEPVFFPPVIKAILKRKAPTDAREFGAYVSQLERDATRFRTHLDRLADDDSRVAERINKFKLEALAGQLEPPNDRKVEPSLGHVAAGVLGKDEEHYEIGSYLVASEQGKMKIIGIKFFNRLF